jgi:ABC-type amino acid transport system permease subunit
VPDILHETNILNAREQNPIFLYSALAIIYFIACYSLSLLVRQLEHRNDLRMQAA